MSEKLTRQGVRDLGGNSRQRQPRAIQKCPHIWEDEVVFDEQFFLDHWHPRRIRVQRCGLCHAERR